MKIKITRRKLTDAGRMFLWNNITLTLLWSLNLVTVIRGIVKYGEAFLYSGIILFLIIPIIVFWILLFTEKSLVKKYVVKLDAKQEASE